MSVITLEYCRANITKRSGGAWYKCRCPECFGNDLGVTEHNMKAYCYECGLFAFLGDTPRDYQSSRELDINGIRDVYTSLTNYYVENLNITSRDYLHNRGMDDNIINIFKLGYCPSTGLPIYQQAIAKDAGIATWSGQPKFSDHITFPYINDGTVVDLRARTLLSTEEFKYKSPSNRASDRGAIYPFNWSRGLNKAMDKSYIVITEGEIKAILADVHDIPIVALPGIKSNRPGLILPSHIVPIIIFDSDRDPIQRSRVDRAIIQLGLKLGTNSRVGTLPLFDENKMDIDAFILHPRGGFNRLKSIIDNSIDLSLYRQIRKF